MYIRLLKDLSFSKSVCFLFCFKMPRKYGMSKATRSHILAAIRRSRKGRKNGKTNVYGESRSLSFTTKVPFAKRLGEKLQIDRPIRGRGAFPNTMWTQHRYSDQLLLIADNTTGRTGTGLAYRLNSLFDPYFPVGGHQPLGFDQLTPVYQVYCVYKVDVQVRVTEAFGSGGKAFCVAGIKPSTSTYTVGTLKAAQELQEQPNNTIIDASEGVTWNTTLWVADVEGRPRSQIFNDDSYVAAVSANPILTPFIEFACGTYGEPAMESSSVRVMVSFVFHTRWSNPNPLPGS